MERQPDDERGAAPADLPEDPCWSYDPGKTALEGGQGASPGGIAYGTAPTVFDPLEVPTLAEPGPADPLPDDVADSLSLPPRPAGDDLALSESLGRGGFGDVWLGRQVRLGRTVAVKCLRRDRLEAAPPPLRRVMEGLFEQEALTAAALEHPNIVPVYQLGETLDGRLLLAMKRVHGRPWDALIAEDLALPVDSFLAKHLPIFQDVAQAVAYAHSQGVLHRDLKPQQVVVGAYGEVMLTDWGLAARFAPGAEAAPAPSGQAAGEESSAGPAGTPAFMAPEQTRQGLEGLGPWTDLYLLGGTLYYLLTGVPPHRGGSGLAAFTAAVRGEITPPRERRPEREVPEELEQLTMALLAPEPSARRPASVPELIEAVGEYRSGVSRQRRSVEIIRQVAARDRNRRDYAELSRTAGEIQRAENLWPANPEVEAQRTALLEDYAGAALERRDLTLARLQAEQIPQGRSRQEMLARVESAERAQRAVARQRRLALAGLALLALVLAAGSVKYLLDQRRAQAALMAERDAARQARGDAEGLMAFMLDELWQRLLEIERVDLLEPVARRASAFYAGREQADLTLAERLNRAKMLATVGDLLFFQGAQSDAAEVYVQAVTALEEAHAENPDPEVHEAALIVLLNLGQAFNDMGDAERARQAYRRVEAEASAGETPALRALGAQALDHWAISVYDEGELSLAEEAFREALGRLDALRAEEPEAVSADYLRTVSMRWAVTLNETGRPAEALAELDRTHPFLADGRLAEELQRDSVVAFAASIRAEVLTALGRPQEAALSLRGAATAAERTLADDPANAEKRYRAALVLFTLGECERAAPNPAAARQAWQRTLAALEGAVDSTDLIYLEDLRVRALLRLDRREEALPLVRELRERGWTSRRFGAILREHGIEP